MLVRTFTGRLRCVALRWLARSFTVAHFSTVTRPPDRHTHTQPAHTHSYNVVVVVVAAAAAAAAAAVAVAPFLAGSQPTSFIGLYLGLLTFAALSHKHKQQQWHVVWCCQVAGLSPERPRAEPRVQRRRPCCLVNTASDGRQAGRIPEQSGAEVL